jgi:AMMECR1 domain-containing protein
MDLHTKLAASAAQQYIKTGQVNIKHISEPELMRQRACYIHILENPGRRQRGSYGTPLPRQSSLAQEIIINTMNAINVPHGRPFRRIDLRSLLYVVAILEPMQRISHASQLHPLKHGLYIRSDYGKSAVLLPQRPGIETSQDQIATAIRESGANLKQETITMYRFDVTYHE